MEIQNIKNLRQFKVTFSGPTNSRGAMVKITEPARYNDAKNVSVSLSYDYAIGDIAQQALDHLNGLGLKAVARCSDKNSYTILCDNWGLDFIPLEA